ncbi:protein SpAN-like [Saccostrea cucullata]|uniref:protein SpAN-like n=1 Tax=Saccostrea cuccullata TaxID=36930 RepID=UPI002ECFFF5F
MEGSGDYGLTSSIHLEKKKGQFTSPGYPGNYPDNAIFTWIIRTGYTAANVIFRIHDMNIINTNPCDDYLEVKEVEPCCFTVFKRCGELKNMAFYTRGNQIRVSFISDRILNAKGFNLSWTVASPQTPQPKVTKIRTTTLSKTSIKIYPSKSTTKLTTTPASRTASTAQKITTISTTPTKTFLTFQTEAEMSTYGLTTIRPTLSSRYLSILFMFRRSKLTGKKVTM